MFYSQFILAKKGPLGTIWIAAHLERKLRKNQVADTDIGVSVDSILCPDVPIALRLSSHLLLGVVRIYSRKVNYLFDDCSETLLKIKQAFRSTAVDLPPEESTAPYHSITLPETFDLDDFELPDNDIFQGNYVDHHISSRDQITLQDTMDGVVYSTSQFGLDERFGDGDISGLDLDEELLLNKGSAADDAIMLTSDADRLASVQPMTSCKDDENHENAANSEIMPSPATITQTGINDRETNFIEYAQAPSTPGLLEEPNLSNVQETSGCDVQLESENQKLIECVVNGSLENASSKDLHCGNTNDVNPDSVPSIHVKENGILSSGLDFNRANPQLELAPNAATMEQISPDDRDLPSIIPSASDIPDGVKYLQNGIVINNESGIHSDNGTREDCVDMREMRLGESTCQPVSEGVLENNQASLRMEVSNNVEIAGDLVKSCPVSDVSKPNAESHSICELEKLETQDTEKPKDSIISDPSSVHENGACMTHKNQLDILSAGGEKSVDPDLLETSEREENICVLKSSNTVQDEGYLGTDGSKQVLEGDPITSSISCEDIQVAHNKSTDQVENVIAGDGQLGTVNSYLVSDLPAPEKLLSVPEVDGRNNLLVVDTGAQVLAQTDGGVDGSQTVSGKKRSYTESTLTMQSINSFDSSGAVLAQRTPESVPDDDDLLSSILVGRNSSFLRVKPTPQPALPYLKRHKPAPRMSASKRKVLMDDPMVLHGDMIRQQLTNTEDIRRVRKKAPCTRPEILMIQKQFLEDEIFSETIFTGASMEFASLHNQTYDLSSTNISIQDINNASSADKGSLKLTSLNDETGSYLEAANDVDLSVSVGPNFTRETGIGGSNDSVRVKDNDQAQPEHVSLELIGDIVEARSSHQEYLEMDIDGKNISGFDIVNPGVTTGINSSFTAEAVRDDTGGMTAGIDELASITKTSETDASLQIDAQGKQADQQLDMISVEIDVNLDSGKKDDDNDAAEHEVRMTEEVLLRKTEDGASVEVQTGIQTEGIAHIETGGCSTQILTVDQVMDEVWQNDQQVVKPDSVLNEKANYTENLVYDGICGEELILDSLNQGEVKIDLTNDFVDTEQNLFQEASHSNTVDAGISSVEQVDRDDFEYSAAGNDTEFLNYDDDDDEEAEVDGEGMPSAEETHILENSGWSSRTRAVAKYLQILFDNEAERRKKILPIDNLVAGKSRKEASRMFFEALVLKTKDYIHVEQTSPFNNINILPRSKLIKSDF